MLPQAKSAASDTLWVMQNDATAFLLILFSVLQLRE
jgi:hypothetical protein